MASHLIVQERIFLTTKSQTFVIHAARGECFLFMLSTNKKRFPIAYRYISCRSLFFLSFYISPFKKKYPTSYLYIMTDSSSSVTNPFSVEARETTFSIMVVSIGMSCFIWQSIESGWMVYKIRKPVHMVVFAQAVLGIVVTFVTLLTSVMDVDCTFVRNSCKLAECE